MKFLKYSGALLSILIFSGFVCGVLFGDGSPAGYTGSPFDGKNCTFCHAHVGQAVQKTNIITTNIPVCGFMPGVTYTINVTVSSPGTNTFGFICSAHDESGTTLGTHIVTDANATKVVGTSTKYITHPSSSTQGTNNTQSWSFDWTAPETDEEVNFYAACTAGSASADSTFVTSHTVYREMTSVQSFTEKNFRIFPNPSKDLININLPQEYSENYNYSVFSIKGELIEHNILKSNTLNIEHLEQGTYVLCIEHGSYKKCVKFYKF